MSDMVMQTRATLHSALNFRPSDLKSLACSHEYSFFVHLSKDKSDCLTLVLSHYSLCFVFAKCQNIAVLLLQGYITLSALKKKKKSKWYNTLEKRKRFGWCWKKKKRVTLHHTTGKFRQANSQPELIWLYSQQTCSDAIMVSLHCLWKAELVWKALHERQF